MRSLVDLSTVVNIYPYDWGNQQGLRVNCKDAWYFIIGLKIRNEATEENHFKLSDLNCNAVST